MNFGETRKISTSDLVELTPDWRARAEVMRSEKWKFSEEQFTTIAEAEKKVQTALFSNQRSVKAMLFSSGAELRSLLSQEQTCGLSLFFVDKCTRKNKRKKKRQRE